MRTSNFPAIVLRASIVQGYPVLPPLFPLFLLFSALRQHRKWKIPGRKVIVIRNTATQSRRMRVNSRSRQLSERSAITTANSIKRSHSRLGLFYAPPLCNLGRNERKWSAHSAFGRYPPPIIIPNNSPTSRHIRVCTVRLLTRLVALRLLVKTNNLISAPLQFRTNFFPIARFHVETFRIESTNQLNPVQ